MRVKERKEKIVKSQYVRVTLCFKNQRSLTELTIQLFRPLLTKTLQSRFNTVSKSLQSADINILKVIELHKSLISFIED